MSIVRAGEKSTNYTIGDELMYLEHALVNHGKCISGNRPVDGIVILENWLKTYPVRRWDFHMDKKLVDKAKKNLAALQELVG